MLRRPASSPRRLGTPALLAVLSLLAAIVLWVAVTEAENPTSEALFSGSIEVRAVNIPEGLSVASIRDPAVSIRVSAPEDSLRRLTPADFRAEVDLSGITQTISEQRVLVRVVGRRDVQVLDVTPAVVTVELEPTVTKLVPVQTNIFGVLPQGYSLGEIEPNPAQVRVTGARRLVELVAQAAADVNLTGLRVTTRQLYPLVPRDARGADVRGVRVEPANSEVRLEVRQQEVTLTLTILPTVKGTVADGYNLIGVSAEPPAVAVFGPLAILQALQSLETEDIDVSALRGDAVRTVRLRIPAQLQSTRDSVTVRIRVAPAQGEAALIVAPQVTSLPDGLRATFQTTAVTVRLAGPMPTLSALPAGSVRVSVSAAGLSEGVHVLRPTVTAPDGLQVVSVEPSQVVVSLHR